MAGLRITMGKEVKYDIKVTIAISCQMDFSQYPFDSHLCTFQVGSYFYDKNSVTCTSEYFDPTRESDFLERNLQHSVEFRNLSAEKSEVRLTSGNYAACGFEIKLVRKHEPLMYQVYIPCVLFVTVSWISFIIDPKVVPGRMSLLSILFLVIINVFNNVRSNAPSSASSRLNAIDKFIMTCIFSIFSAIIEYAIVLSILWLRPEKPPGETVYRFENTNGENAEVKPSLKARMAWVLEHPRVFDAFSIIIFPTFFFFFNIHYWFFANYQSSQILTM
ncbi:gamma-aminobutyric acid receptor subunit gamma-2 [Eurytemora carolleeae]|uniref:gamma-aminobutyric acid receptor subunit gamma-2 n=1 Tax=Eurytemora carolleeae TaxID=1294199 RepID=UPI000C76E130|nr:gamma-aminobutyric acid receptor subunit gamma-2 [Eurytemora carolleeae]|eukprot:XP_023322969.1 gamma-aminobutyric acid receptor subunit gamma-2-like [Eurytemora affinis]